MNGLGDEWLVERLIPLIRDIPDYPKPGILFKDITPLLADATAFADVIDAIAVADWGGPIDKVVGVEARGFILAAPVAIRAHAGFIPVRKKGKLPSATHEVSYALEYGEAVLEVHKDSFQPGERVLIVDDVLATGGTMEATMELVRRGGSQVAGVAILLELTFLGGRSRLRNAPVRTLLTA